MLKKVKQMFALLIALPSFLYLGSCSKKRITLPEGKKTANNVEQEEVFTSLEPLKRYGISITKEEANPVFYYGPNPTIFFDCYENALLSDTIEDFALYMYVLDFGNYLMLDVVTTNDEYFHECFNMSDSLYAYFKDNAAEAGPKKIYDYNYAINLGFYFHLKHPCVPDTDKESNDPKRAPTYDVGVYNEADLCNLEGITDQYTSDDDFNDYPPIYLYNKLIPAGFDDNPIVSLIPKQYFRKPITKTYLGTEYGFYIKTEPFSAVGNKSEFFVFSTKHTRGCETVLHENAKEINNKEKSTLAGCFVFELRPIVQGTIFYIKETDTVCGMSQTNTLCIKDIEYSFITNNRNDQFNTPSEMIINDEINRSCYIEKVTSTIQGQLKSDQSYSKFTSYFSDIASFINNSVLVNLLSEAFPLIKVITGVTADIASAIDEVYQHRQETISKEVPNSHNIEMQRNIQTDKVYAYIPFHEKSQSTGSSVIFKKEGTPISRAMRGYTIDLKEDTNNKYPILYKKVDDSFKTQFKLKENHSNYCFAQNILCRLSFSICRDEKYKPLETLYTNENLYKYWTMSYDPYNEFSDLEKINAGETYFSLATIGTSKSFSFTPQESATYAFTYMPDDEKCFYTIKQAGNNVSSVAGIYKNNCQRICYSLNKGMEYTFSFYSKIDQPGQCFFRIDRYDDIKNPYEEIQKQPFSFKANGITSQMYPFYTEDEISDKENYLIQTFPTNSTQNVDTIIELLDEKHQRIAYADDVIGYGGSLFYSASLTRTLKTNTQYYVCVKIKRMFHSSENVSLRIMRCRELGNYDVNNRMTYNFRLGYDNTTMRYHFRANKATKHYFRVYGEGFFDNVDITVLLSPAIPVKNTQVTTLQNDSVLEADLSETTYYVIISYKKGKTLTRCYLQFMYWRNL